jgi:hypothetical protein
MSHSGITPLPEDQQGYEILVSGGMLLPSGEGGFFDFRQHTSSDWDSTTPTGTDVIFSSSGDWDTRNESYVLKQKVIRHKKYKNHVVASGINYPFPHPYNDSYPENKSDEMFSVAWWEASGVYQTYPPANEQLADKTQQSGIFHWKKNTPPLGKKLTNSNEIKAWSGYVSGNLPPETPFNDYIHYLPEYPFHEHQTNPVNNLIVPDYKSLKRNSNKPYQEIIRLRDEQERKFVPYMNLYTIQNRNKSSIGGNYKYDEEKPQRSSGTFSTPDIVGICIYPNGSTKKGVTAEDCGAFPGAIFHSWEGACIDSDGNCTGQNKTLCLAVPGNTWFDMTCQEYLDKFSKD